ncbi:MAG: hypothetical protein IT458_13260 [Planctomycetes bacterium]|nr:hypothetical protein [Planctomycetota bacterium]
MKCQKLSRQELRIQVFSRGRQLGSRAARPAGVPARPPFPAAAPSVAGLLPGAESLGGSGAVGGSEGGTRAQGLLEFVGFLGVGFAFLAAAILL